MLSLRLVSHLILACIISQYAAFAYLSRAYRCGADLAGADNKVISDKYTACCGGGEVCAYQWYINPMKLTSNRGIMCHAENQILPINWKDSNTQTCYPMDGEPVGTTKGHGPAKGSGAGHGGGSGSGKGGSGGSGGHGGKKPDSAEDSSV